MFLGWKIPVAYDFKKFRPVHIGAGVAASTSGLKRKYFEISTLNMETMTSVSTKNENFFLWRGGILLLLLCQNALANLVPGLLENSEGPADLSTLRPGFSQFSRKSTESVSRTGQR